jgi:hypothetical protein
MPEFATVFLLHDPIKMTARHDMNFVWHLSCSDLDGCAHTDDDRRISARVLICLHTPSAATR